MATEKTKSITLPEDLWKKIADTAYEKGRNQKGHIRIIFEDHFAAQEASVDG